MWEIGCARMWACRNKIARAARVTSRAASSSIDTSAVMKITVRRRPIDYRPPTHRRPSVDCR